MTKKENKKTNEQEKEVEDDGGNQEYFELVQQANYCMYLISTFKTKKECEDYKRKSGIICIGLIIVFLCALTGTYYFVDCDGMLFARDVIFIIEMPFVMFIFTNSILSLRNTKIENENRINEFIKSAMPLINTQCFLANVDYEDIEKYYLYFTNPNDDKYKNSIPEDERPDVL